jgi:hypothetical protein
LLRALLPAVFAVSTAAPLAARAEPFLRGPYPFRNENDLTLHGGYGVANGFSGVRAGGSYGFQAAGSLWVDIRIDVVDAHSGPPEVNGLPCEACARVDTFVDVFGGVKYKLRTNLPLVPYGGVVVGPVYLFNEGARSAAGVAARASVGAKYFLYEWLGLGAELGGMVGGAWVEDVAGLETNLRMLDVGIGAEVQF